MMGGLGWLLGIAAFSAAVVVLAVACAAVQSSLEERESHIVAPRAWPAPPPPPPPPAPALRRVTGPFREPDRARRLAALRERHRELVAELAELRAAIAELAVDRRGAP